MSYTIPNRRHGADGTISVNFTAKHDRPLDDRMVVRTVENLMDPDTWIITIVESSATDPTQTITWSGSTHYAGMVCSVVADGDNNGLYMLVKKNKYNKQSWDPTDATTYDPDGWMRIGGGQTLLDESRQNEAVSPGSFTKNPDGEYYSDFINGGTF